jgi:chromosome segregation ATPase
MPAIIALAMTVVGLNVALFITVDGHKRSMDGRELALKMRENEVISRETRVTDLQNQISDLQERRRKAIIDTEDAQKSANDAQSLKRARDQLADAVLSLNNQGKDRQNVLTQLMADIEKAKIDEAKAKNDLQRAIGESNREITEITRQKDEAVKEVRNLNSTRDQLKREAEAAHKAALDAVKLKTDRDAIARELEAINKDLTNARKDFDGLKRQIANEVDEEKQLQKMLTSRREALKIAETELEKRKSEAADITSKLDGYRREAEAAQKSSADALKLKNDRDAVARELEVSTKDVTIVRRDIDGLKRQLANDSEEQKKAEQKLLELTGTIKQAEAARILAEKLAIEKRVELNQLSSDLAAAQADLSRVDAMRRSTNLTEADFQRVQRSKMEAEKEVAEQKADLNDLQRRVGEARATLKATVDELTKIQNSSPRE